MAILIFFGILLAIAAVVFLIGGIALGWYALFAIRRLHEEVARLRSLWAAQPPTPAPSPVPQQIPPEVRSEPLSVPREEPPPRSLSSPAPSAAPVPVSVSEQPPRRLGWERKFLENWTGILGLVIVTLGVGFLGVYGATIMPPLGRFILMIGLAAAAMAAGHYLIKKRLGWLRWGFWLQSLGAAVILLACLGSGGIQGLTWVTHPLAALGLLVLGVAVNFYLGFVRRKQPYLTFHAVLCLVAFAVPVPNPLILLFLTVSAVLAVGLSWFQSWAYHRTVMALVFQTTLVISFLRLPLADQTLQWLFLAGSVAVAFLIHAASYRRLERGSQLFRPALAAHLVNAGGVAVAAALWAPRHPIGTLVALGLLALGLFLLASRARERGPIWLYRVDRLLALLVAVLLLGLNPAGALPMVLVAILVFVVVVFTVIAREEGDQILVKVGDAGTLVAVATLPLVSWLFPAGSHLATQLWNLGASFAAGLAVIISWLRIQAEVLRSSPILRVAAFLLPMVFTVVLGWTQTSPTGPVGIPHGLWLLAPWTAMAWLVRRTDWQPMGLSLAVHTLLIVAAGWILYGLPTIWGMETSRNPWLTGVPITLLAMVPLAVWPRRNTQRFSWFVLITVLSLAPLAWFGLGQLSPVLPVAAFLVLLAITPFLHRLVPQIEKSLPSWTLWLNTGIVILLRILQAAYSASSPLVFVVDGLLVVLLVVLAVRKDTGPWVFWELAVGLAVWFLFIDPPVSIFPILMALLALLTLTASLWPNARATRLAWPSVCLFVLANLVAVFSSQAWIAGWALAILVGYVVTESLLCLGRLPHHTEDQRRVLRFRRYALVGIQSAALAVALPRFLVPEAWTFGWCLVAFMVFLLAILWKDPWYKNASFLALGICLVRLIFVDLSNSDLLLKALLFLSVGGLMVGMNLLYLWSEGRIAHSRKDNADPPS